ncbi:MAG TPA: biotin attachment protein [Candidatus Marinimicrobia bacterium]|nr:biotin attachment protein [Candidatus Neomarinimicrobiota bacterium]
MIHEVIMPVLGETMDEGKITCWRKKVGDKVEKGEILLEVETDKANLEVESFFSGYLRKILVNEGEVAPVKKVIALISDLPDEPLEEDQ